jgi:hypothetical protein
LCSVRRVGAPLLEAIPRIEGTLGAADRCPRRGGKREAVLDLPARASRTGEVLGGLGKGAQAPGCAGLSSRHVLRAHDRRCPSEMDRGNAQPAMRPSRVVAMAGLLCGESRSGPDLSKLGWRGAREGGHATGCAVRRGLHLVGHNAIGFEAICCCARGSKWSQKSAAALGGASRKRATQGTPTMEGALDRGSAPPLTRRRAEAVLVLPQGSATEGVRGQGHGLCPGRKRRDEGASRGGLEITSSQVRASLVPRETRDNRAPAPKLWARRQARPHSIMLSAKVSTGRAAWKLPSPAKADGGGDSRARRSVECSCQRSVAEVG